MISKFWDAMAGRLVDRWLSVSAAALVFWSAGAAVWASGHGGRHAFEHPYREVARLAAPGQFAVLFALLLGVGASALLVERMETPVLRLIEGYWPPALKRLSRRRSGRFATRAQRAVARFAELEQQRVAGSLSADAEAELAQVTMCLRRLPARPPYLPTAVGNTIRAAERRPADKYGLDAVATWLQLWLVMPDPSRAQIAAARDALDTAVAAFCWGLLFTAFAAVAWWAAPVGLTVAAIVLFGWIRNRAQVYADHIEAAFDLNRRALYEALRWPLPTDPDDERHQGRLLTTYLLRGLDGTAPTFVP